MKNLAPKNPRRNQAWVDDDGVLRVWDGSDWALYDDVLPTEPEPLLKRIDGTDE